MEQFFNVQSAYISLNSVTGEDPEENSLYKVLINGGIVTVLKGIVIAGLKWKWEIISLK